MIAASAKCAACLAFVKSRALEDDLRLAAEVEIGFIDTEMAVLENDTERFQVGGPVVQAAISVARRERGLPRPIGVEQCQAILLSGEAIDRLLGINIGLP